MQQYLVIDPLRALKGQKGISALIIISKQQLTQMETSQMGCQCVDDLAQGRRTPLLNRW